MIHVDGGSGLPAALPSRPSRHPRPALLGPQDRNIPNKLRKSDREDIERHLHDIMNASNPIATCNAARRFADRRRNATRRPSDACGNLYNNRDKS